jgi:thioredoxin reductase (NADPH)
VAVIGSGPAGLTAAIYTTRGAASTVIFGGESWGGQLMLTTTVDNFPGIPGVQGPDLMERIRAHATRFGGEFVQKSVETINLKPSQGQPFELTVGGKKYQAKSIIIATGAETRWLGVKGEKELIGKGVSSCAPCDAPFFKDKNVAVVGGGDSAMEEALVLTKYATTVTIIHRRDAFRASAAMIKKVMNEVSAGKIKILWNSEIVEMTGKEKLENIVVKDNSNNTNSELIMDGVFVAIGHVPSTSIFAGQVDLDEKGYVKKMPSEKYLMATSREGVFVAGDVHDYHFRQAVTAAGFGCMAGLEVLKHLDKETPSW